MSVAEDKVDGRTLRHQHRRPELLDAAVEYILEHGIAELSLRPMADELGVSHSTLIRHFGTKEALVTEVIERIRSDLFNRPRTPVDDAPLGDVLRATWRRLCEPAERRQFVLLFEVVAMQARDPERFGSLAPMLITDFLGPLEASLRSHGLSRRTASDVATGFLAQVRGLQLDLAVSGDQRRVDAAMNHYIDSITRTDL
ncbi:MAG TPA: TetR/AcrR family transcriptional regulator [Ilumatobacteraceae bacterium]|nr:TetR/AcrR family transcriptional regulator [Ilumatobacteraceae bacterium]